MELKRYRILIQENERTKKHVHQITFDSVDIEYVISKLRCELQEEIAAAQKRLIEYVSSIQKGSISRLLSDLPADLIDWHSKGSDIEKEAYIENEMYFDRFE